MNRKKWIITVTAILALTFALAVPSIAFAAEGQGRTAGKSNSCVSGKTAPASTTGAQGSGRYFVDADGDGVCDFCQQGEQCRGFVDADGDGVCDYQGENRAANRGAGYVDANGDGVCDYQGEGRAAGRGAGYVDADNDGICDYYEGQGGTGCRNGRGCN